MPNVRFGSKADMRPCRYRCPLYPRKRTLAGRPRHVRFVPEADMGPVYSITSSASPKERLVSATVSKPTMNPIRRREAFRGAELAVRCLERMAPHKKELQQTPNLGLCCRNRAHQ